MKKRINKQKAGWVWINARWKRVRDVYAKAYVWHAKMLELPSAMA